MDLNPSQLYLKGGGTFSTPGVAALLAEADRGHNRREERQNWTVEDYERDREARLAAQQRASEELLASVRAAEPIEYAAWLSGYLAAGGQVTHEYDYNLPSRHFFVAVNSGMYVPALYGAMSVRLIVPAGVRVSLSTEFHGNPGHSSVYFMDGFRQVGNFVPLYEDVRRLLTGE